MSTSEDRAANQLEVTFKAALLTRRFRARFAEKVRYSAQTEARWSALYHLSNSSTGVIQTDLAERMGVQGPTLVRLLDALEEQKLVARQAAPEDRRVKRVVILPAGLKVISEIDAVACEMRDACFAGVPDEDLRTTLRVLDQVGRALEGGVKSAPVAEEPAENPPVRTLGLVRGR
jgi:MarR family transcriptional regulator for hemolysin